MMIMSRFLVMNIITLVTIAAVSAAHSQGADQNRSRAKQAAGLQLPIEGVIKKEYSIIVQIAFKNVSKARQYVVVYGSAKATLNSGEEGSLQRINGVLSCSTQMGGDVANLKNCRERSGNSLDNYTYIEPDDAVAVTLEYNFNGKRVGDAKEINFAVLGLVRAQPESLAPVGPIQQVTVNFSHTPVDRN